MITYRDTVNRVSLAQLRAKLAPRVFRARENFEIEADGVRAVVRLVSLPAPHVHGGVRRWLVCPSCGLKTQVVGVAAVAGGPRAWCCSRRACGHWRSRRPHQAVPPQQSPSVQEAQPPEEDHEL